MGKWLAAPLLLVPTVACQASATAGVAHVGAPRVAITPLTHSLGELRAHFNEAAGGPRVVALLSPTCEPCLLGVRALRVSVLDSFPDAAISVSVIWMDMIPGDDRQRVAEASELLDDPRVRHFYDPKRRAGRAFADGLLPTRVAWDTYLFYAPGSQWVRKPPPPVYWSHQLGRIESEHFHPRDLLFEKLFEATRSLVSE